MKRLLSVLVVLLLAAGTYWLLKKDKPASHDDVKTAPIVSKKHSDLFNNGIDSLLNEYFSIKDAFVNSDTGAAKAAGAKLIVLADSGRLAELKKDMSGIYESAIMLVNGVKTNTESLLKQPDLTEMKQDFRMIGESLYPLLKTIHYEGKTLYLQNCPMAFGEDKDANWISNTEEIINPYLGKNHPQYKATMLHCGEVKDSIKAQ